MQKNKLKFIEAAQNKMFAFWTNSIVVKIENVHEIFKKLISNLFKVYTLN